MTSPSFDPANVCGNVVAEDDDGGCGHDSYLSVADLPAGTYTVVVTDFFADSTGSYTLEFNTPPPVCS